MSDVLDQYNLLHERGSIMHSLRQYILAVTCITAACSVLQMLLAEGTAYSLIKMLSGLIISIAVLTPLIKEDIFQWDMQFESIVSDASVAIAEGQTVASEMVQERIKERTEEYILTKASDMDADITVSVELETEYPNKPEKLIIRGRASPYVKQQLAASISKDLGILEEDITWIS